MLVVLEVMTAGDVMKLFSSPVCLCVGRISSVARADGRRGETWCVEVFQDLSLSHGGEEVDFRVRGGGCGCAWPDRPETDDVAAWKEGEQKGEYERHHQEGCAEVY